MEFGETRASGILMPVASLPGDFGIGDLGRGAYDFVDFAVEAGQKYWQILPIGPTGYGDSPYQSFNAFSGNPYFISLEKLREQGLLTGEECMEARGEPGSVDYARLYSARLNLLRRGAQRMAQEEAFTAFCEETPWLDDYALFMAIKGECGDVSWQAWPQPLRMREPAAMEQARERLEEEILFWKKNQYWFYTQWAALKAYANGKGLEIIGDIPIYISPDSCEVWKDGALFQLDGEKRQTQVAGVPPDAFSADGQVWGNPLYNWEYHRETDYAWWGQRLRHASAIYDVTRIDHFRGFCDYFAIPAGDKTARNGKWMLGPGKGFIDSMKRQVPGIRIIAEDLGYLSPEVAELLEDSGFPGMKVLQFAFDSRESGDYLPHNYPKNSVVYTGTHDNTTTADWEYSAPLEDVKYAKEYLNVNTPRGLTEGMIRAALGSVSFLAVIPLQDWMELGKQARINTPSTLGGNWTWRAAAESLTPALARRIRGLTSLYGRIPAPSLN